MPRHPQCRSRPAARSAPATPPLEVARPRPQGRGTCPRFCPRARRTILCMGLLPRVGPRVSTRA
eukprot:10519483-Lingulodinium_polyedra.AAC.1